MATRVAEVHTEARDNCDMLQSICLVLMGLALAACLFTSLRSLAFCMRSLWGKRDKA